MVDSVAHRLSSLALRPSDIVIIVGLESASQYNYRAANVCEPTEDASADRIPVLLLHGNPRKLLSVRRRNLLRAANEEDRQALLTRIVLERQLEFRVSRPFLEEKLHNEVGLLLHIASFFPTRETMALTTGFAMGRIVPSWCRATLDPRLTPRSGARAGLSWQPLHADDRLGWEAANVAGGAGGSGGSGGVNVPDGIVRIDCAVVHVGSGRYLVAGGCADHPSRARKFFRSAFLYDSLVHVATALPDMPCRRHGCGGAYLDGKVYVVGGDYVAPAGLPGKALISVLDLKTSSWSSLDPVWDASFRRLTGQSAGGEDADDAEDAFGRSPPIAFVPVGAVDGRLVILVEGLALAFNPRFAEHGWRLCTPEAEALAISASLDLGTSACACCAWGRHLVVSAGRNGRSDACHVAALSFLHPPTDAESWAMASWSRLGPTGVTGRVGCGICVLQNRLYISGGVHEGRPPPDAPVHVARNHGFDETVVRWSGTLDELDAPPPDYAIELESPADGTREGAGEGAGAVDRDASVAEAAQGRSWRRIDDRWIERCRCEGRQPWETVEGLALPTAMHAHHAIAIPWLPGSS